MCWKDRSIGASAKGCGATGDQQAHSAGALMQPAGRRHVQPHLQPSLHLQLGGDLVFGPAQHGGPRAQWRCAGRLLVLFVQLAVGAEGGQQRRQRWVGLFDARPARCEEGDELGVGDAGHRRGGEGAEPALRGGNGWRGRAADYHVRGCEAVV
eukprot:scaffold14036_cov72-Isochrysis_galbana.AAC.1